MWDCGNCMIVNRYIFLIFIYLNVLQISIKMQKQTGEQQTTFWKKRIFIREHFSYMRMIVNLLRCNFKYF